MNSNITNGQSGGAVISNTTAVTGHFAAVQAINTDVVIDTVIGTPDISGKTIAAGVVVAGSWSSVKRTSGGDLVAYYA